jgi:hypothetical protein
MRRQLRNHPKVLRRGESNTQNEKTDLDLEKIPPPEKKDGDGGVEVRTQHTTTA